MAVIEALGTALPDNRVDQAQLTELAESVIPDETPGKAQMLEAFENTGIRERALAESIGWYLEPHGHRDRHEAFVDTGLDLIQEATTEALDRAGLAPADIGAIVGVTTTGIATPSLEARLVNQLPMDPATTRVPVWGLGCAGGVAGLNRAAELARATPGQHVLLFSLELCSLSFSLDLALDATGKAPQLDKKTVIAASLFGDGCATAILTDPTGTGRDPEGPRHRAAASHLFEDTEHLMGWDVTDRTLDVVLSPEIPPFATEHLSGIVHPFLDETLGQGRRPDHWVMHPGGTKVLGAYAKGLGLDEDDLALSRKALADHGNMSSPTVLFALDHLMDAGLEPGDTALMAALGPGFAAELALLEA